MSKGLKVPTNPAMALRALNSQHATAQDDAGAENTTILQTDKQTNQTTDTPTNQDTNPQSHIQTVLHTNSPTYKHTRKPTRKPTAQQINKTAEKSEAVLPPAAALPPASQPQARIDGRTIRVRQETSDRTMVTSMRLSVSTIDQLDEFCWKHRQRKQDVIQEALTLYFQTMTEQRQA